MNHREAINCNAIIKLADNNNVDNNKNMVKKTRLTSCGQVYNKINTYNGEPPSGSIDEPKA